MNLQFANPFSAPKKTEVSEIALKLLKNNYNIASRATQSNSVYVSVLQISTVLADGVSKSLCQNFFSRERPLSARGKILYFTTMMDTETRPTSPKTNTIFQPFLVG